MARYKVEIELDETEDALITKQAKDAGVSVQEIIESEAKVALKSKLAKLVNEALMEELAKVSPGQAYRRLKSFSTVE